MCANLVGIERSWWSGLCKREGKKVWWSLFSLRWERRQGEIWFGWRRAGILLQLLPLLRFVHPWSIKFLDLDPPRQVNETSVTFQKCYFQLYPSFQRIEDKMVTLILFSWPVSVMPKARPHTVWGRREGDLLWLQVCLVDAGLILVRFVGWATVVPKGRWGCGRAPLPLLKDELIRPTDLTKYV